MIFAAYETLLHSFLQGWIPPPPSSEGTHSFLGTLLFLKPVKKVTPLFLRAIQIGACKLYETLKNEDVTLRTILSQLTISLSLIVILSGSALYLLLTFALVRYCL